MSDPSLAPLKISGRLDDRVVMVTGAASGMGQAIAALAANSGAHVIALDISNQQETVTAIRDAGGSAEAIHLDVSKASDWDDAVRVVIRERGRIDCLANVAGIVDPADNLLDLAEESWDRLLAVDLKGTWLGMRAVVPHMLEAGYGRILNIASVAALIGLPDLVGYTAAKGGVTALTRQVAVQYAARGLRVNAIAPGPIRTPLMDVLTDEQLAAVRASNPLNLLGKPMDVARTAIFLLGEGSDFITGQVIAIDGGWTVA